MSYHNPNPMFMSTTRPPSQGYPPYGGPGMASGKPPAAAAQGNAFKPMYVSVPFVNQQWPSGADGNYPGGGRAGAEASAAQVMVGVPMYQGTYMQSSSGIVGNAPQMLRPLSVYPGAHIPLGASAQSHPAPYNMAIGQPQPQHQQQQQSYYKGGYMQPPPPSAASQQQQQQSSAASVPKRKKNILQIIDPSTGQVVNPVAGQENKTAANDAEPAAAATALAPAPADSSEWGAQFAAQVAATLDPVAPRDNNNKPNKVQAAAVADTAGTRLQPSPDAAETVLSEKTPVMTEPTADVDAMPVGHDQSESPAAEAVAAPVTPVEAATLPTSGSVPSDENKISTPLPTAVVLCDTEKPKDATQGDPLSSAASNQPIESESCTADDVAKTKANRTPSKMTTVKNIPQRPISPQQQQQPTQTKAPGSATAPEAAADNGNKKKNRKKNKDLNTKGKVLQGSDMDAFIDEASKPEGQKAKSNAVKSVASRSVEATGSEVVLEPETSAQNSNEDTEGSATTPDNRMASSPAEPGSVADVAAVSDSTVDADSSAVTDSAVVANSTVVEKTSLTEAEKMLPVESAIGGDGSASDNVSSDVSAAAADAVKNACPASSADGDGLSSEKEATSERLPSYDDVSEKTPAVAAEAGYGCDGDVKTFQADLANDESKEDGNVAEAVVNNQERADDAESGSSGSGTEMEAAAAVKPAGMQLKYTYSEDQWSPLNPEGKKQYDRNFMLQLQFANPSVIKPIGLPQLPDIILNEPRVKEDFARQLSIDPMSPVDFTPGFIKQSLGGGGGGGGGGGNRGPPRRGGGGGGMKRGNEQQQQQQQQQQRKVITLEHNITLHTTQNAWKPATTKAKEAEVESTEEVYKKIRGILNKLTPQKFTTLIQKVQDLPIDTEERLTGCINIIFEKAISEPNFSVAYANMAKCLIKINVPLEADPEQTVTFRKLLLNKCQQEFEKDKAEQLDIDRMQSLIDEADSEEKRKQLTDECNAMMSKAKRRSLGNIRFIGELFKLKMLTEKIMHECLSKLLRSSNDEDSLECLCQLLTTIGQDIDNKQQSQVLVNKYFAELQGLIDQKKTSARIRFMILDTMDMRKNKWVSRRQNNNPKTIEQIHKEAEQEEQEKQLALQKFNQEQRGRRGPPARSGPVSSAGSHPGDDGWTAVGRAPKSIVDPARMKLTKQPMDENVQLGPGGKGMSAWHRGSSGGLKTLSQEGDRPMPTPNRFSALGGFGSESMDARSRSGGRGAYTGRLSGPQGRAPVSRQSQERASNEMSHRTPVGGRAALSPMGSRSASQEIRNTRDKASSTERLMPRKQENEKEVSEAEVEKKTKSLMEEYLHGHDIKEAALCVEELGSKSLRHFVYHSLLQNLERTPQARNFTGKLHLYLVKTKQMKIEHYVEGLRSILEFADEMVIDIPRIWVYLGELISPLVEDGTVPLTFLRAACQPLVACDKAGVVVGQVLHTVSHVMGHRGAAELWLKSGLRWTDFMKPDAVESFIVDQKLRFTEEPLSGTPSSSLSMEQMQEQLTELLTDSKTDKKKLCDWVGERVDAEMAHSGSFIRAFTTSICFGCLKDRKPGERPDNSKIDADKFKEYANVLARYLKHEVQLELEALYAVQSFVHKLEHPPGMLQAIWTVLYDDDIITEAGFYKWKNSSEPSEAAGKGVALTSVAQFYKWMDDPEKEESAKEEDPDS